MIGKDENNQVHASDSSCNNDVVRLIAAMKILKDTRDCIDYLSDGKTIEELKAYRENTRMNQRAGEIKKEIGMDKGDER